MPGLVWWVSVGTWNGTLEEENRCTSADQFAVMVANGSSEDRIVEVARAEDEISVYGEVAMKYTEGEIGAEVGRWESGAIRLCRENDNLEQEIGPVNGGRTSDGV